MHKNEIINLKKKIIELENKIEDIKKYSYKHYNNNNNENEESLNNFENINNKKKFNEWYYNLYIS